MNIRRLAFTALCLAWGLAAWSLWDTKVPSVPSAIFRFERPTSFRGVTRRGEYVAATQAREQPGGKAKLLENVLCFWKLPEQTVTRRFETAGPINSVWCLGTDLIAILSEGRLRIIDTETFHEVDEVDHRATQLRLIGLEGRILAYLDGEQTLVARDILQQKELWRGEKCRWVLPGSDHFVVVISTAPAVIKGKAVGIEARVFDPLTGERVARFDHLGTLSSLQTQANSPFAIVRVTGAGMTPHICRLDSGESLATLSGFSAERFSRDGQSISLYEVDSSGIGQVQSWPTADGRRLVPRRANLSASTTGTANSPLVVEEIQGEWPRSQRLQEAISRIQAAIGTSWTLPRWTRKRVVDLRTGAALVHLGDAPPKQQLGIMMQPDEAGLTIQFPDEIRYYALPPRRNWALLAQWALLPPAGLLLIAAGLRRAIRRLRRPPLAQPLQIG